MYCFINHNALSMIIDCTTDLRGLGLETTLVSPTQRRPKTFFQTISKLLGASIEHARYMGTCIIQLIH